MSDEIKNIEYNFTTKGVNETAYDFTRVADAAASSGKSVSSASETSTLGVKSFNAAAKTLAREVGLSSSATKIFGSELSSVALSLGTGATAVGVLALGVTAAIGVVRHFSEAAKEKKDVLDRSVSALKGEVSALYANRDASYDAQVSTYGLLNAKKDLLRLELDKQIKADERALKDEEEQIKRTLHAVTLSAEALKDYDAEYGLSATAKKEMAAKIHEENREAYAGLAIKRKEIELNKEYRKSLETKINFMDYSGQYKTSSALSLAEDKRARAAAGRQYEINDAILEAAKARATDLASIQAIELEQFDNNTQAKLSTIDSYEAREDMRTQRYIARKALEEQHARQTEAMKQKYEEATLQHSENAFKMIADLGGTYGRAAFRMYQVSAIGKTIISTKAAMMRAYEEGGPYLGPSLAIAIGLEGAASVATIAKQKYEGGGSSSDASSSSSTGSANSGSSNTGVSTTSSQESHGNIYITIQDKNGKTTSELIIDMAEELYLNGGTAGGYTFSMERSG